MSRGAHRHLAPHLPLAARGLVFCILALEEAEAVQRRVMKMRGAVYAAAGTPQPSLADGGQDQLPATIDSAFEARPDVAWLRETLPHAGRVERVERLTRLTTPRPG